jgi:hypothetical protein
MMKPENQPTNVNKRNFYQTGIELVSPKIGIPHSHLKLGQHVRIWKTEEDDAAYEICAISCPANGTQFVVHLLAVGSATSQPFVFPVQDIIEVLSQPAQPSDQGKEVNTELITPKPLAPAPELTDVVRTPSHVSKKAARQQPLKLASPNVATINHALEDQIRMLRAEVTAGLAALSRDVRDLTKAVCAVEAQLDKKQQDQQNKFFDVIKQFAAQKNA